VDVEKDLEDIIIADVIRKKEELPQIEPMRGVVL
jgi:hypothetical protein